MRFAARLALLTCLVAGCTIGSTDTVEEIEPGELAALDRTSTTSTTTLPPETTPDGSLPTIETAPPASGPVESVPETSVAEPTELVELYFVNGSEIVPVDTPVAAPVAERRILDALGLGPPPRSSRRAFAPRSHPTWSSGSERERSRRSTSTLSCSAGSTPGTSATPSPRSC